MTVTNTEPMPAERQTTTPAGQCSGAHVTNSEPMPAERQRRVAMGACLLVIGGIGWLDYATGPELGFSLFYLLPVVWAAYQYSRVFGLTLSVAATVTWFLADFTLRDPGSLTISLWNGITRLAIFSTITVLLSIVRTERARLRDLNGQLLMALERETQLALTDGLTGLANSRALSGALATEIARAQRNERPVSVAYIDVDNFKRVNDTLGHAGGDELLFQISTLLTSVIRAGDVAARMGGDEFAVLFAGLPASGARPVVERFVQQVQELASSRPEYGIGVSVGIAATGGPNSNLEDADSLVRRADEAMYRAKAMGKGQVVVSEGCLPQPTFPSSAFSAVKSADAPAVLCNDDHRPASVRLSY